jgi:hypothetical protein
MENPQHAKRRRPLLRGCLVLLAVIFVLGLGALFLLYRQVVEYTATEPVALPVKKVEPGECQRLERRWKNFASRDASGGPREVTFGADDLNAMIAGSSERRVRELAGRVFFRIKEDQLFVDASIPLEDVPLVSDRYFNGSFEVRLDIVDGRLEAEILNARTAGGAKVPGTLLEPVRAGVTQILGRYQESQRLPAKQVEIKDGKLLLRR